MNLEKLAALKPLVSASANAEEAGASKPSSLVFDLLKSRLGVADPKDFASVLHVGDSFQADVVGAARAGFRSCWLVGESVADDQIEEEIKKYGGGGGSGESEDATTNTVIKPDIVVRCVSDLLDLLP